MHRGYVKLHRKFKQWEWYRDSNVKILFLELLLTANHSATKFKGFNIPAGSVVTGRNALAEQTGLSAQQVRTALNKLKSTSEITSQPTHDFSIISIVNWNDYQSINQPPNHQATSQQPASNQPVTTSKECKNEKNGKKKTAPLAVRPDDVPEDVWGSFIFQRKARFSTVALSGFAKQAAKASVSMEVAMRESTERGWQSFKAEWYLKKGQHSSPAEEAKRMRREGEFAKI